MSFPVGTLERDNSSIIGSLQQKTLPNNPGRIPFRSVTHNRVVPVVARSAEMCGLRVRYALFNYFLVNGHLWLRILDYPSSVCLEEALAQVPEPPSYKVMTQA